MSGKTEKMRGAEVRKSRAKSRVQAGKRSSAEHRRAHRAGGPPAAAPYDAAAEQEAAASPVRGGSGRAAKRRTEEPRESAGKVRRESGAEAGGEVRSRLGAEVKKSPGKKARLKRARPASGHPAAGEWDAVPRTERARDGTGRMEQEDGRGGSGVSPARMAVLGVLLVLSLGALLWIYTGTGVLNVRHVEIRGNEVLDESYLRSLSGITADTHLLKMNVKAVEKALMSEPYIASVDVMRHYPDTVVLTVRERLPGGAVLQNGRYHLVDQEGMVLASSETLPAGVVEIRDLQLPLMMPGTELKGVDFAMVTSLLGSLPRELREKTSAVGLRQGDGLYLEAAGTAIIYGEASELSRKNDIALMALERLVERYGEVEYIDVSFPDHPVIKPLAAV